MPSNRRSIFMAYYLVSRMPPGETQLIQASSARAAARALQPASTASYRATETFMVTECDKDGVECAEPVHFTADELLSKQQL
jgi:hypothetical protein